MDDGGGVGERHVAWYLRDQRIRVSERRGHVGEVVIGYGDDPKAAPYLGAFAPGEAMPWYGPRPEKK